MLVFEILPAAIGIAISPLPVMIVVLLLVAGNSRSAIYYVVGWLLGIVAVGIGLVVLADVTVHQEDPVQADAVAWASILLGLFFLIFGYLAWRGVKAKRDKRVAARAAANGETVVGDALTANAVPAAPESASGDAELAAVQSSLPGWMTAIDKVKPLLAVGVALVSALNPKNFSMILLAISDINHAEVGPLRGGLAYLNFAALATITVAIPVLYWYFDRNGAEIRLKIWQRWLAAHQQEIMMWLFGVLGTLALVKGLQKLF